MIWKQEPGPEPHSDNTSGRRSKAQSYSPGERDFITYFDLHLCSTRLFCPGLDSHTTEIRGKKGKKTENTVTAICLEPNPGTTREFFLIKHCFLVSSESLRNKILFKLHELILKNCY